MRRPVVGPTEALRGRAGGPGLTVPPGAVPGLLDPEKRSGWQLAQRVWAQAGVSWEVPAAAPAPAPVGPRASGGPAGGPAGRAEFGGFGGRGLAWDEPADAAAPSLEDGDDSTWNADDPAADREEATGEWQGASGEWQGASGEWEEAAGEWDEPPEDQGQPADRWYGPVEEPPARADDWSGPASHRADPSAHRAWPDQRFQPGSGWGGPAQGQFAPVAPETTGQPGRPVPASGWNEYPADGHPGHPGHPGQSWPAAAGGRVPLPPGAFAAMPLGAPVTADRPAPRQPPWPPEGTRPMRAPATRPADDPDALFLAWQGSVRQAAGPRGRWSGPRPGRSARPRRRAWQAAAIGVPAAVIVTVGAGALMMLTGRANEMLAIRGDTGTLSPGASAASAGGARGGAHVTGVVLAGYPGQHGSVAADSVWSADGASLAVGDADGHPAIWQRGGGSWALVSAAVLGAIGGNGTLTAVAHGPAGWIAVGLTTVGGTASPLVLGSADGVSWQPVTALTSTAGPGVEFLGVAAGPDGYAVVGRQLVDGRIFASLWWSSDLRMWVNGANGGLNGRLTASTANAATATATGFVAVGSHGSLGAIWTSPDGAHWNLRDIPAPSGARGATLRQVTASGNTIVATGYAATAAGDIPLAVVSADGGAHWQTVSLPAPGGLGLVTALTTKGNTLIAAGLTGAGQASPAGTRHFVTWTSPDGLHWSSATAVTGITRLSALSVSGGTLTGTGTGTAQHGADPSIMEFRAP